MTDDFTTFRHGQKHDTRYVLRAPDGAVLHDIEPEHAAIWAMICARSVNGCVVDAIVTRLDSIPQVWP